jgi:site-specific DNA-methyltransferase (adenine-specific)
MALMARYPDKYFELAIVDPPYGIGASEMTMGSGKNKKYKKGKNWDTETPSKDCFKELFRVSKNQIIWGGNYFPLPLTKSWIFWDKGINGDCDFADGELAWTSFNKVLRIAPIRYKGFLGADKERIHPTQKPVALYKWLLHNYAKQGDKILDTHLGSGSIAIACHDYGFDLTACELDKEYFDAAMKRIQNHTAQGSLF